MSRKVLFLVSTLEIGGSEKKAASIANELASRSCKTYLAYLNPPDTLREYISENVSLSSMNRRYRIDLEAMRKYKQYIQKHGIEVVVAINLYPMLFHEMGLIGVRNKPKLHVSINDTYFLSAKEKLQMIIYSKLLKKQTSLLFGSQRQKRLWISKYQIENQYTKVVYNGIDTMIFSPERAEILRRRVRDELMVGNEEILLVMVAGFRRYKRHRDVIEATKILQNEGYRVKSAFVGTGPEINECKAMTKELGLLDRITFLDEVKDVGPILSASDIFVLTSETETFSNAALEAMSMERPVVITDVGGAREMIDAGLNGFLFAPGDIDCLVASIKNIIDNGLVAEMGRQARRTVLERFTFRRMVNEYRSILGLE
jgi:glycosyltransferase involved in cell wall biosynthesis